MNFSALESLHQETIFLDHNISGTTLSRMLRAQGLRVLALEQVFGRSKVPDLEWLEKVGIRKWIAFTDDRGVIQENADFLFTSDVRLFVVHFKFRDGKHLADEIRARLGEINIRCRGRGPFVYEMYAGHISRVNVRKYFRDPPG